MRMVLLGLLAFGLAMATGRVGEAQQGLRGHGGAIGGFHLIMMPQVQQELQLTESQVARAKGVADRMGARFEQDMTKMKGLNADERMKRSITLAGPHYEEGMNQLQTFLKPAQLDRFDQILFQMRGPRAMLEPKIAQTLQLRNEQAQKVAALVAKADNDQRDAVKSAGNDRRAGMMKVGEIATEANNEAASLLSPEQQQTWKRLTGEPFRPDMGGGDKPTEPSGSK